MTPDEIIRMAQEAGFDIGGDGLHAYHPDTRDELPLDTYLEHFAALVAAHERNRLAWTQEHWTQYEHAIAATEREACAKAVEEFGTLGDSESRSHAEAFAAAIRARGEK